MSTSTPVRSSRRRVILIVGVCLFLAAAVWLFQPSRRAQVHLERGKLYLRQGRAEAALQEFGRTRELAPPAWEARFLSGEALADAGRGADAIAAWRELDDSPFAQRALAAAAEQARKDGDAELALALCNDARTAGHAPAPFLAIEGRVLAARGETVAAAERLRQALDLRPERVDFATELATILRADGRLSEAESVLTGALDVAPESVPLMIQLAELQKAQARPEEALALYRRVLERKPTLPAARTALMQLLMQTEAWPEAEAEATDLLDDTAAAPIAHFVLGQIAYRRQDYAAALEHLDAAKRTLQRDPAVLLWLGKTQIRAGRPTAALSTLRAATVHAPQNPGYAVDVARGLWELSRYGEANTLLANVTEEQLSNPEDREFLRQTRAEAVVRLQDAPIEDLLKQAEAALRAGDFDGAHQAATVAQQRAPEDPRPLVMLAFAAAGRKDVRMALGFFEEARRRDPANLAAAFNRARLLQGLGRPELAVAILRHALAQEGARVEALVPEAATLLLALGRGAEAEALIREHPFSPAPPQMSVLLARALLLQGRATAALEATAGVGTAQAEFCRMRALFALRRDEEALAVLDGLPEGERPRDVQTVVGLLRAAPDGGADDPSASTDTPIARACALARGRQDQRDQVVAEQGALGTVLAVVAAVQAGEGEAAAALQSSAFPGTEPIVPERLPANVVAYKKALLCQILGWPEVAWRFYADAGELQHPLLLLPVVQCAVAQAKTADALAQARRATRNDPPVERLWLQRIALERESEGDAVATDAATRALRVLPESADLLALAGQLAQARGENATAVALFRKAIAAGATGEVRNNLAWLLLQQDPAPIDEALELALAADGESRFSPHILDTLATCYLRKAEAQHGLYFSNLALLLDPFDLELRLHRAQALVAAGHAEAVVEDCRVIRGTADAAFLQRADVRALCGSGAGAGTG